MADKYPTLTLMGINNPDQIESYSLTTPDANKDVIRIKYRRPSGSLLPTTRKYEFDRTARAADPAATGGDLQTYEISPVLNKALLELDSIVRGHDTKDALVDDILEQIADIEQDFAAEVASLRAKLAKLRDLA